MPRRRQMSKSNFASIRAIRSWTDDRGIPIGRGTHAPRNTGVILYAVSSHLRHGGQSESIVALLPRSPGIKEHGVRWDPARNVVPRQDARPHSWHEERGDPE